MKLFDVVPGNFFSVLSSGNREIYCEAILLLHEAFKSELNIRLDDFRSSLISHLEDKAFEVEDDEEVDGSLTLNVKASLVLNKLIRTGWVEKEYLDNSFIEILTPRSYAIPVMKLIAEIGDNTLLEYNSLVFATFSGLKQAAIPEHNDQMYEAVLSAKSNTEQLQYLLRSFYHSVRGFLSDLVDQHDVNTLLENHFGEFIELSDRIYHPIKTMDSFYRYQNPIQSLLTDIQSDSGLIRTMRDRAMAIKKYTDTEEADREIFSAVEFIMDAYRNLGGIINEIDRKKSTYTRSTSEKIRYLSSADQSIQGKLAELLKAYANANENGKDQIADLLESRVNATRQEVFDSGSLYHKSVQSRRIQSEPVLIEKDDAIDLLSEGYLLEQIKGSFPAKRINAFIESLFPEGTDTVSSADIDLGNDTEFILLLLAVIQQKEPEMTYSIQVGENRVGLGGYIVPDMVIRRKGSLMHVE